MTFTYAEVGATAGELPDGYAHLRERTPLRTRDLDAAAEAVLTFAMHRAAGARVRSSADRAAPGVSVRIALGLGFLRFRAPCRVVWCVAEPDRAGFAYGTLPGHPECGEESFVVRRAGDGRLALVVTAFSRPARPYASLGGGVARREAHAAYPLAR
jgi:uncharacterized protein (UPF0548 family)